MGAGDDELRPAKGFVEPSLEEEFPGLRIDWVTVPVRPGKSPPGVKERLTRMSSRFRGSNIIGLRADPVPHAYRSFFRQIGLDPDTTYVPVEQAAFHRLYYGGFKSQGVVEDACLVAVVETGVPVYAVNADRVAAGGPTIRTAAEGERVGTGELGDQLAQGRLVVADEGSVYGPLFGEIAEEMIVVPGTARCLLYAVAVPGVPDIHLEEALWIAGEMLRESLS